VLLGLFFALLCSTVAKAADCYQSSIMTPTPFMGNNDEIFQLADGTLWQVKYEYSYLYEYYPSVMICPSLGKLVLKGKALNVVQVSGRPETRKSEPRASQGGQVTVVFKRSGCRSYFLADGDAGGIYLLEWYGGYDPDEGDSISGDLRSYGFKDVFYLNRGRQGRVYVDDYMLSRERAIEKMREKCR